MTRSAALAAALAALALSGCQTTQTEANYVKVAPGPKVDLAIAQCKEISSKARHIVVGIGGPEMLVVGLVGTAVATAAKQAQVFEQCMAAQGYGKAGAKPAETAGTPAAAPATKPVAPARSPAAKRKTRTAPTAAVKTTSAAQPGNPPPP